MTMIFKRFARADRAKGVTAVLGPTNTGKTHLAIERMLAHGAGIIGLPLRLLAREVYGRVVEKAGPDAVALVTGEEKIKPEKPRYWVATVEAMPRDIEAPFVAIDEIQLAADLDRGHVFTDRLLNARGTQETLIIGSSRGAPAGREALVRASMSSPVRASRSSASPARRRSRGCRRAPPSSPSRSRRSTPSPSSIRRQKGGAAVVLGALSPRTRNAQVELFQAGDVDYIVATDAIGMGLNLDVDHVAFAADRKFDGHRHRRLTPAEMGQVAGRAGPLPSRRHFRLHRPLPDLRPRSRGRVGEPSLRCARMVSMAQYATSIFRRSTRCKRASTRCPRRAWPGARARGRRCDRARNRGARQERARTRRFACRDRAALAGLPIAGLPQGRGARA